MSIAAVSKWWSGVFSATILKNSLVLVFTTMIAWLTASNPHHALQEDIEPKSLLREEIIECRYILRA